MKRRQLLLAAAALTGLPAPPSLRGLARRAGLPIGSSAEIDLAHDPAYAALIAANATLFAPNMSWQRMSPTPDRWLTDLDPNVAWARRAGLRLTGYHLLWHQRLPPWFDALDRPAAERAIADHIGFMASWFGPDTFSWNVINEAIRPADGAANGLRRSPLSAKFGDGFFDLAFDIAHQVAPGILRVYNDYDLELSTPNQVARQRALLRLLDRLAARAVPIQAVGLQSHLRTATFDHFDPVAYRRFLGELAARGLEILITELDVADRATGDIAQRDQAIADIYARFLDAALAQPKVRALVFWGLSDRYSWLNDPARPNYRRPDGLPGRPLPFDPELRPTPALAAVRQSLRETPPR